MTWAIVAGAAVGAGSSFLSGQSANRAGRQAQDWNNDRFREQRGALGGLAFGGSYLDMMGSQNLTPEHKAQLLSFLQAQGLDQGGIVGAQNQLAGRSERRGAKIGKGYDNQTQKLAGLGSSNLAAVQNQYAGLGQQADQWGRGRAEIIRRDAGTANTAMNQQTQARLAASGFGNSTAAANQMAGNATATNRAMQDQLQGLSEAQLGQKMQIGQAAAGATERIGGQNVQNSYARSAGRTDLQLQNLIRNLNMRQAPLNTALGVQQSQIMNPWLTNPQGPGAGVSPIGAAGGSLAASLGAYGAYQMAQRPPETPKYGDERDFFA